ncbi:TPA: hypothetical protein QDB46_003213 [Burkholderia multivorans]|nr:hypothetical protein [Burkholderia multivorans]HDR9291903.1 hypothetical protein [Burkholderia multivorans]HDR9297797.1 hypothetical protein [Burkholderia multivorans]HDR9303269.1 hypothetical protein [Burkholderia multivorans]HDR9309385.1 hypothetical protein [Burkholderia multivorans]
MNRFFASALLALASVAFGATTTPVQLLNPSGSTAGQAIISNGPSTPPTWGTVSLSGITGTLAIANGGTGATSAPAALTNLLSTSTIPLTNGGTGAATASSARQNLGLGTAATSNTGTSGATVPLLNGANTWSGAQTFSALITPSSTIGIKGTVTNDDAQSGSVGEWGNNFTSGVSLTTGVNANCASASLAAGDYDVRGTIQFIPAATTTVSAAIASISTTSATAGGLTGGQTGILASFATGQQQYVSTRTARVKLAAPTTVYLVGALGFGTSTATCSGWLEWRRVR